MILLVLNQYQQEHHGIKQKSLINHFVVQFGFEIPATTMKEKK